MEEQALIERNAILKKIAGKGGWTYAEIPEILPDQKAPFGWRRVKGSIDDVNFSAYHLMPMGNGHLFLPVKAEIRKKIGKKEGDTVKVVLYPDPLPDQIPDELIHCLEEEPIAFQNFNRLILEERKKFSDWVYSAKNDELKVKRIASLIEQLLKKTST
ncbi:MAG: DUF1905 domain-containing protein [Saprospiraceae bacterium]|nr:DUF1905 domain-containing protein [Saprospiraceae bacterium]